MEQNQVRQKNSRSNTDFAFWLKLQSALGTHKLFEKTMVSTRVDKKAEIHHDEFHLVDEQLFFETVAVFVFDGYSSHAIGSLSLDSAR